MNCEATMRTDFDLNSLLAEVQPGFCLPRAFYTDERIHAEDIRRIYQKQWLFTGHACQIPKSGDYFTYKIGDESLIITRDRDGQIHALHNSCRHRGSLVCNTERGHANKFVCPYHQWVFDHDGALLSARRMPEDFDKSKFGLKRAHVRLIEGLIFINLAESPLDFEPIHRDFSAFLSPHGLSHNAKIAVVRNYETQANWKLVVENSRECYHCHFGHPEYSALMLSRNDRSNVEDVCALHRNRFNHYQQLGLRTEGAGGPNYHISRYPFAVPGAVCESQDGKSVAPIMGTFADPDAGVLGGFHFPNFMIEASSDHLITFRYDALSARRTSIQVTWYVREDAVEGRDYDPAKLTWFWKTTGEQDWKLAEDNQLGVNSTFYEPGPYAPEELGAASWVADWYIAQLRA